MDDLHLDGAELEAWSHLHKSSGEAEPCPRRISRPEAGTACSEHSLRRASGWGLSSTFPCLLQYRCFGDLPLCIPRTDMQRNFQTQEDLEQYILVNSNVDKIR